MGKKRELLPVEKVDLTSVKYEPQVIEAPHLTGVAFKIFVKVIEAPLIGSLIISYLRGQNKMNQLLLNTVIPEAPMFKPEYPPQEREELVTEVKEDEEPEKRVEASLNCLPQYDPNERKKFRYWKIRDYAHAYRSKLVTPSIVAENVIFVLDEFHRSNQSSPMLISYDFEDIRRQAAASTRRFEEGTPKSVLDGIFVAIKDDINCFPFISKGATTWLSSEKKDAVCVSKLRKCGVIFVGKANMHELGMGTTGNNSNYGTTQNPHDVKRYTGGSSSGPAAIVASGICSAALGTDGGGSVRIPSSLCGLVGLKTTFGRTDPGGLVIGSGTVEIVGPLTSSVEDSMLIYAAILGSCPDDRNSLKPGPPCIPNLKLRENLSVLGSLRLGKYSPWFNDVQSTEISNKCEDMLALLTKERGCEIIEVVIPELVEMSHAHVISIGSECLCSLTPHLEDGYGKQLNCDTRTSCALFQSFTASDYIVAQKVRRRLMHYHMDIFKKVDVLVTPTTGTTAPEIHPGALKYGETDFRVNGYLMRFVAGANLLGLPAISVPVGYDINGLPIGLQFIGKPWAEATILRLASAVEELFPTRNKPSVFYDVLKVK